MQQLKRRESSGSTYVALKDIQRYVKDGVNILAIEAHAVPDALDLSIDPSLILED